MKREDVAELHYIASIANVPSILELGILCYKRARKVRHTSVAMQSVQDIRADKAVPPGTRRIHDFANLYFHARNPMMFKRCSDHKNLCVLRVDASVMDLPDVCLTDQNAASKYVRFYPSPSGLAMLDRGRIFARDWTDEDTIEYWRRKSAKCAEVLVPSRVDPEYVFGSYVSGTVGESNLRALVPKLSITIDADLFSSS